MKFKKIVDLDSLNTKDMKVQAEVPIAMASSIEESGKRIDEINKELDERQKQIDDFVKEEEGKKDYKIKLKEPVYKKMGLVEHASRMTRKQLKESRLNEEVNRVLFDRVKNALDSVFESTDMTGNEFRECIKKYLYLFETDEDDVDECLKEAEEEVCPNCGEKDCDGSCEKKPLKEASEEDDLWTKVYNNLATDLDINEVNREVPDTHRGCRYEKMSTDFNGNIVVYAPTAEEMDFAKQVADHYGLEVSEVKEDKNPRTNTYYKYSMTVYIPEED